ncbi:hypothetical protein [Thermophilibacter sp.]
MVLSHLSALAVLRRLDPNGSAAPLACGPVAVPHRMQPRVELRAAIRDNPALRDLDLPLDLLVSHRSGSARTQLATTHLCDETLPADSALTLAPGILCSSPERLAVEMAPRLTRLELVMLLAELMGLYAIAPDKPDGMVQRTVPLTTPQALLAYLGRLGPRRGTREVREALAVAPVRAGSPREAKLALRLSLRPGLGGYGLRLLSLNDPVRVRRIERGMAEGTRRPDIMLVNPKTGTIVAVEYNGRRHDAPERLDQDARRTNELKAAGIGEFIVRRGQYRDLAYMDGLAEKIREQLGLPRQRLTRSEQERRLRLRRELYQELERIDGIRWDGRERERERRARRDDGWDVVPAEAYGLD